MSAGLRARAGRRRPVLTILFVAVACLLVPACGRPTARAATAATAAPTTATRSETSTPSPQHVVIDTSYTPSPGPRVAIIGDSLTLAGRPQLHAELSDYQVKIAAGVGEGIGGGPWSEMLGYDLLGNATTAYLRGPNPPDALVIALGTNNLWFEYATREMFDEAWPEMVADYEGDCLVVVTASAPTEADEPDGYDPDDAVAINEALASRADVVVDWAALDTTRFQKPDHIHLLPEGLQFRARLIREAVDSCGLANAGVGDAPTG